MACSRSSILEVWRIRLNKDSRNLTFGTKPSVRRKFVRHRNLYQGKLVSHNVVDQVDSAAMRNLCGNIKSLSSKQKSWGVSDWPRRQLDLIAQAGVYRWFVPPVQGGLGWSAADIARSYIALGASCLTSTFIVTQRVAALKRIASGENDALTERVLPSMLDGRSPGTVGISHLTTSGRHLRKPVLKVRPEGDGYVATGRAPWVTGAPEAGTLLLGGVLEDEREILFLVSTENPGVTVKPGFDLVALSASHTGVVEVSNIKVTRDMIVAGPKSSVLNVGKGGGAGGVQTSALALGLARSAIDFIAAESGKRSELKESHDALESQFSSIADETYAVASGTKENTGTLRADANSLVMRSTQAAMIAAKGAGFVKGHPVGRWCGEALFFLVWSCPQTVAEANLCELVDL